MNNINFITEQTDELRNNKEEVIVIDTSYLISAGYVNVKNFLIKNKNSIIPKIVLRELNSISIRKTSKNIDLIAMQLLILILDMEYIRIEISDDGIELNPNWTKNNDFYILTVCKKLQNQGYLVKLLSFDKVMLRKAEKIGIERYPIEFPNNNVKRKNNNLSKVSEKNVSCSIQVELASDIQLKALKNRFSNNKNEYCNIKDNKRNFSVTNQIRNFYFEKLPKIQITTDNDNFDIIDDFKSQISTTEGVTKLIDNSSIDIYLGVLKTVINCSGKIKDICLDEKSLYYEVDPSDRIIVFTNVSNFDIKMEVFYIDKCFNCILENVKMLREGEMRKINKKYHRSIKEAFIKILKIKLLKVA